MAEYSDGSPTISQLLATKRDDSDDSKQCEGR